MKLIVSNENTTTLSLDDDDNNEVMKIMIDHVTKDAHFDISFSNAEDYSLSEIVEIKKVSDKAIKLHKGAK